MKGSDEVPVLSPEQLEELVKRACIHMDDVCEMLGHEECENGTASITSAGVAEPTAIKVGSPSIAR